MSCAQYCEEKHLKTQTYPNDCPCYEKYAATLGKSRKCPCSTSTCQMNHDRIVSTSTMPCISEHKMGTRKKSDEPCQISYIKEIWRIIKKVADFLVWFSIWITYIISVLLRLAVYTSIILVRILHIASIGIRILNRNFGQNCLKMHCSRCIAQSHVLEEAAKWETIKEQPFKHSQLKITEITDELGIATAQPQNVPSMVITFPQPFLGNTSTATALYN